METKCSICPRGCNIDREKTKGFCNENNSLLIAKIIKNFQWEEPCITGEKGTLAIFFSGCNLKCDYCQNYKISRGGEGQLFSIDEFVKLIEENQETHSSIDLITPTHFSRQICKALKMAHCEIPVVWNTNSYETVENIKEVSNVVDIFLADFKYANNDLCEKFSSCKNYCSVCVEALKEMCKQKPDKYKKNQMTQGVIIRHLVLPNHIENSFQVLDIIKKGFPDRKLSLMSQFTPNGKSALNRKLKPIEYKAVLTHLEKLKLTNGYIQDFASASDCFVPDFD